LGLPQTLWVEWISYHTPNSLSDPDRLWADGGGDSYGVTVDLFRFPAICKLCRELPRELRRQSSRRSSRPRPRLAGFTEAGGEPFL